MYVLEMEYSWGDKESKQRFKSFKQAWEKAQTFAMKEAEVVSTEHESEVGMFVEKNQIKEEGKISLHYLYDNEYCYYNVKHVPEYTELTREIVFTSANEMYKHFRYWCTRHGELPYLDDHKLKKEELPKLLNYAYSELWSKNERCSECILEFDGEYYLSIERDYNTKKEYENVLEKLRLFLFSNKGCRIVIGKGCNPFGRHEVYFLVPANMKKEAFEKLEKIVVSALCSE